ncbi:ATP-binding protein [Desulfovibrio sp. SGI.169]|uniref:ATP-binding protein n=1 Tax=Desulfovibrio sp. SGI.169 TaxID=3420561 RepID=UPI003D052686
MKRPVIEIDEAKCNGCGQCVLDCAEGALAVIDGKARLISEVFCDGLGACLNCPQGALSLTTREAPEFDEKAALAAKARRQASDGAASSARHTAGGCPGSAPRDLRDPRFLGAPAAMVASEALRVELPTWPIQLRLASPRAPFLDGARLLLAAHCAGFALPRLHQDWLPGRVPLIACPKLEDSATLLEKLTDILRGGRIARLTVLRMSVPCCGGLDRLAREAMKGAGCDLPLESHVARL